MQQNMMEQNIIITEPSSNLRALGRNALDGKWKLMILAVLAANLCMIIPAEILTALFGTPVGGIYFQDEYSYLMDVDVELYNELYSSLPEYSPLSNAYTLLVTGAFTLGISLIFLAAFRRQIVELTDVFLGFERFGKALGLLLFQTLFICLWSLLFVVPGIIASLRYSQAFFILADDPNKGIRQCMNESKMMMKGNKAKYFCLSLSFIGWMLLAILPAGILEGIAGAMSAPAAAVTIIAIIGSLFIVPVEVYMYSAYAGFYEILAGHLIKETEPAPVMPNLSDVSRQDDDSFIPKER